MANPPALAGGCSVKKACFLSKLLTKRTLNEFLLKKFNKEFDKKL